jgi:lipopolysaccharide export system permease protein
MRSIGRYIFRTMSGAFLVVLVSVTALMWITQALRDTHLMTNEGQSILTFVGLTALIIDGVTVLAERVAARTACLAGLPQ